MEKDSTSSPAGVAGDEHFLCDDWGDPLESGVRTRIRGFIEGLLKAELDAALGRERYEQPDKTGGRAPQARGTAIGSVGCGKQMQHERANELRSAAGNFHPAPDSFVRDSDPAFR